MINDAPKRKQKERIHYCNEHEKMIAELKLDHSCMYLILKGDVYLTRAETDHHFGDKNVIQEDSFESSDSDDEVKPPESPNI